jgi:hypothetical protein
MGEQWGGKDGNYYDSHADMLNANQQWEQGRDSSGNAAGGGGLLNANTLGKGMGIGAIIALLIPFLLAGLFELLFRLSFKLKLAGRIIQSALLGTVFGVVVLVAAQAIAAYQYKTLLPVPTNFMIRFLLVAVISGLPALWYYFSNYFSLKAAMYDERFSRGDNMFLVPFAIALYGVIALLIINAAVKGFSSGSLPTIIYFVPVIVAAVWYIVKILAVREGAKILKKEEGTPIVGLPVGIVIACILPLMLANYMASEITMRAEIREKVAKERVQEEEQMSAFFAQLKPGMAVVVTKNKGKIFDPSRGDYTNEYGTLIYTRVVPSNSSSDWVKYVKEGDILTVTGEGTQERGWFMVPVEHQGARGWIEAEYIGIK